MISCGTPNEEASFVNQSTIKYEYEVLYTNQKGNFEAALLRESQNTFYTAITYTGEEKEVEITHSSRVFRGLLYDENGNIAKDLGVDDVEMPTTLKAKEPLYEDLGVNSIVEKLDAFEFELEVSLRNNENYIEIPISYVVEKE